jgi:phage shock protein C
LLRKFEKQKLRKGNIRLKMTGGLTRRRNYMGSRGLLRRSRRNRMLAGVCGGLAEFLGISSFWIRLGFFILFLPGGLPGALPYLILWIVVPSE